jgi:hypothetical protein
MADPTIIPDFDADEWALRIMRLFPSQWSGDDSKKTAGVLYSLFKSFGSQFEITNENLLYDFLACRIATAKDVALDAVAADFFGAIVGYPQDIVRAPGEPDDSFRLRIYSTLLLPMATRGALSALIMRLTGQVPRIMEPWSTADNAVLDRSTYIDVDTVNNPSRIGDSGFRYSAFLESILPSFGNQGNNPIYCIDKGFCLDAPSGYLIESQSSWWLSAQRLDQLVNKVKPLGTKVYRRYLSNALITYPIGVTRFIPSATTQYEIDLYPPFAGYVAIIADANWETSIFWQYVSNSKLFLNFGTAAPSDASIDFILAPITYGGYGSLPIAEGLSSASLAVQPQVEGYAPIITPNWDTSVWVTSLTSTELDFAFSNAAPLSAQVDYGFFAPDKSIAFAVSAGATSVVVPISAIGNYQAFALPTWNTKVDIDKGSGSVTVLFSNAPSSDETLYVATFP